MHVPHWGVKLICWVVNAKIMIVARTVNKENAVERQINGNLRKYEFESSRLRVSPFGLLATPRQAAGFARLI